MLWPSSISVSHYLDSLLNREVTRSGVRGKCALVFAATNYVIYFFLLSTAEATDDVRSRFVKVDHQNL